MKTEKQITKHIRKVTDAQLTEAIRRGAGILGNIQSIIKKEFGVDITRQGISKRIVENEELQRVRNEATSEVCDLAESTLIKQIRKGNMTATIFYLKTKGRDRGYIERKELTGENGSPIETTTKVFILPDNHRFIPKSTGSNTK